MVPENEADAAARTALLGRLIATRKQQGLSQRDLAERMGCSKSGVAVQEGRRRYEPKLSFLQAYARALGGTLTVTVAVPPPGQGRAQ